MKKLLFLISVLLILMVPDYARAQVVTAPPAELKTTPVIITGYQSSEFGFDFIQIYNTSSQLVLLDNWTLDWITQSASGQQTKAQIKLQNWLPGNQYAIIASNGTVENADLQFTPPSLPQPSSIKKLQITPPADLYSPQITKGDMFEPLGRYLMQPTEAGNFTTARPFTQANLNDPLYGGGLYMPPQDTSLRVVEILANPTHCSPTEADSDLTCRNYVKIFNSGQKPVALDFFQLRLGWGNQNIGINNRFELMGTLLPGEFYTVTVRDDGRPLDITSSGGYAWIEDVYGLKKYQNTVYRYPALSGENYRGFSWALNPDSKQWQWGVPSPNSANDFSRQPAVKTNSSALKPCLPGQERNLATNRCRNIASTTSTLTPCKPGQKRNPATNRCRSTAAATSALKPCDPGQERNPQTNRCRKVAAASTSLPSIQDVQSKPDGRNYRWWIVGSVVGALVLFGIWEWRHDIATWALRRRHRSGRSD